ncbi:eotaxin-like [Oreochromis aureus]|uniref:Chemokine interleukin-8-like domain-containing protein n=1 Tax=Oreochromis aureus TaxID=47969 RepID=A0AAZ1XS73_OREAU|nr:eotaxin-like [Oreochromis aureus]
MSVKILSITLLLVSTCVCCHSEDAHGPGSKPPCCVDLTKGNVTADVVGETYREQAARYPCVKAIIFNTKNGQICADPNAQWVKDLTARMTKAPK